MKAKITLTFVIANFDGNVDTWLTTTQQEAATAAVEDIIMDEGVFGLIGMADNGDMEWAIEYPLVEDVEVDNG